MTDFSRAVSHWDTDHFDDTLKLELKAFGLAQLPLEAGLTEGGMVSADPIEISILDRSATPRALQVKLACFFTEVVGGCNCHDDPYRKNAYCELRLTIDRASGLGSFSAIPD